MRVHQEVTGHHSPHLATSGYWCISYITDKQSFGGGARAPTCFPTANSRHEVRTEAMSIALPPNAYPYVFFEDILAIFGSTSERSVPFCLRMRDVFERSGISLRDVVRVAVTRTPPWEIVRPQIDTSLSNTKSATLCRVSSSLEPESLCHPT